MRRGLLPSVGATIRMYKKLFALRTYRRRLIVTLLAFFGATVTIAQLSLWIAGQTASTALAFSLVILTPIGVVFALLVSLPKADISFRHGSATAPVRVLIGDIFATAGSVTVITMNRHFDTAHPWVSADSLVTQLIQRCYAGRPDELRSAIAKDLALQQAEQPTGKIVRISAGEDTYLLLAVADRHEQARSSVAVDAVWSSLSQLWQYARLNNISRLRVPVIGSGFARAQVGRVPLIILLLTSYLTAAMEMPVCGLEIVLHPDDADLDLLELVKAYCEILGYRAIDQKPLGETYFAPHLQ
jgi:Thoeris protein ThsA, Macro domain